jgi:hypothetical protein
LEKRVVIEVDGGQHNEQLDYDAKREAWLKNEGFVVLRFWDHEVLRQIDDVKQAIWTALNEPPSLVLPRKGGEEEMRRGVQSSTSESDPSSRTHFK